jgi:enolase-phosphatase E1
VFRAAKPIKAILLDIEGTTTPLDFVTRTLFPYARTHLKDFLARRLPSSDLQSDIAGLRAEHESDRSNSNPPPLQDRSPREQLESLVSYLHWLMDLNRKSTPLKSLQGKIWEEGYRNGELRSEVFADVPTALTRWASEGPLIYIFSSGSVLAQKLLFAHTARGDLTGFIRGYFDTNVGAKIEPESYRRISSEVECSSSEILFISDVLSELDAARSAGLQTAWCVRPGNPFEPAQTTHPVIHTFDEILLI